MSNWIEHYAGLMTEHLSPLAIAVAEAAFDDCHRRRTCYPQWGTLYFALGISLDAGVGATEELERAGLVSQSFPTTLVPLQSKWPLPPMFGPDRLAPNVWAKIRQRIFERDDFTCAYCGSRGGKLECDHIVPVARGGGHDDDNLTTACRDCNRAKRDKLVSEWLQ